MRVHRANIDRDRLWSLLPTDLSDTAADALLHAHIVPSPDGFGADRAVVQPRGVSVWMVIADLDAQDGDVAQVMENYSLTPPAILAAILYYREYADLIDARIALNEAAFLA